MKILTIHVHNIASIEGPFVIDLEQEPLKSSGLFAITGATGAGKSTILDAICLALYNDTPRLASFKGATSINDGANEITINNVKNLLRKGAVSGYAKVSFLASDGKIYLAEWHIRKARNKSVGQIQNETMSLTNITDNQVFNENRKTLVLEKIKQLVGLSFDEFTKSVILAQGDFTSFLKANDDKRSDILEKLTGTEIYTKISKQIHEKNKIFQTELEYLSRQLSSVNLFSDEERQSIENQLVILEEKEKIAKNDLEKRIQQEQWFQEKKTIEEELQLSENQLDKLILEKDSQAEHFSELEMIVRFQHIKSAVIQWENEKQNLKKSDENITKIQLEIEKIEQNHHKKQHLVAECTENLLEKQNTFENYSEEIEKYKEITILIQELEKNIQNKQDNFDKNQKNIDEIEQKRLKIAESYQKGQQFVKDEEAWLLLNSDYGKINDNYLIINDLISESERIKTQLTDNQAVLEELAKKELSFENELLAQSEFFSNKKNENESLKNQIEELKQKLPKVDLFTLNENRKKYTNELQIYQNDAFLVDKLTNLTEELVNFEVKLIEITQNYHTNEEKLIELSSEKEILTLKYQFTDQLYQKKYLENSKNVIFLRQKLIKGEECPVCGSCEHPNAHQSASQSLVDELEKERNLAQAELDAISKKIIYLESVKVADNQLIKEKNQQLIQLKKSVEDTQELFKKSEKYSSYPDQEKALYIESKIKEINFLLTNIETDFNSLNSLNHQLNELEKMADFQQEELKSITEKIASLSLEKQKNNHQKSTLIIENQLVTNQLKQYAQQLNHFQLSQKWLHLWESDLLSFKNEMEAGVARWKAKTQQLHLANEKLDKLQTELNLLTTDYQLVSSENKRITEELNKEKTEYELLISNRKKLLNGEEVFAFEKRFKDAISLIMIDLENLKQEVNLLLVEKAKYQTLLTQERQLKEQTQELILSAEKNVTNWISDTYPNDKDYIFSKYLHWTQLSELWLEQQVDNRNQLNENILKVKTIIEEKQQNLQKYRLKNEKSLDFEQIKAEIVEKRAFLEEISLKIQENKSKLLSNQEKEAFFGKINEEKRQKEEIATRWKRLNDLIGSSTGSVFRKYAQEYTLDILLKYANIHIKNINKRYTLERIANTLSIKVLDHDMGGEIRSVYSLSGGESFLVSLSLSLALSSLSSLKMNIETLFIDEGFGTLDADTLSIALDALESLQHQGKKVGVISHIQEMVERIPVKINVKKEGYGKSKIEII